MFGRKSVVAALLAAIAITSGTQPAAAEEQAATGLPLWVYGHSYTTNPGVENTPGAEWMPELAERLGSPTWRTFGVGSSRMIDTYSDIARSAPRGPVPGSAWDSRRGGVVVLQSEFNDMINPWGTSRTARPLSTQAAANYEQTLQASLALLSAERRYDSAAASTRGGWRPSYGPAYLGGGLAYTTQRGAFRDVRIDVGASGTAWVITWEVSNRVRNPRTGVTQISVDGRTVSVIPPRTASWEAVTSRRAGGYLHTVGPRATAITGLTPGRHTIRVAKADAGPGAVYFDQVLVPAEHPVPVVVVQDPPAYLPASSYTAAYGGRINANRALLHRRIDAVTGSRIFPHVVTATLADIRPEDYGPDGIHLSDAGMDFEASQLEEAIRRSLTGSR